MILAFLPITENKISYVVQRLAFAIFKSDVQLETDWRDLFVFKTPSSHPGDHNPNDDHHLAPYWTAYIRDNMDSRADLMGKRGCLQDATQFPTMLASWIRTFRATSILIKPAFHRASFPTAAIRSIGSASILWPAELTISYATLSFQWRGRESLREFLGAVG